MAELSPILIPLEPARPDYGERDPFVVHKVRVGDSLWQIAGQHGLDPDDLIETNLHYNLPTLLRYNPDLLVQMAVHSGPLYLLKIEIRPGQLILIPKLLKPCREEFASSDGGRVQAMAVCPAPAHSTHRDPVYVMVDPTQPLLRYSYVETNVVLQLVLEGRRPPEPTVEESDLAEPAVALEDAISGNPAFDESMTGRSQTRDIVERILAGRLDEEAGRMNCSETDISCYGRRAKLFATASERRAWLEAHLLDRKYDPEGDGYYSEANISDLIQDGEAAIP